MPRIALINMVIGFSVIALAAAGGAFIANDLTRAFLQDIALLNSWDHTVLRSAHGHTNLFGLLHIAFGLTIPYSVLQGRYLLLQTIGLLAGTVAMGPGLIVRSMSLPSGDQDFLGLALGALLSFALLALISHAGALAYRITKRV